MRKGMILLVLVLFVVGCGRGGQDKAQTSKRQGVEEKSAQFIAKGMQYLSQSNIPLAVQSFDQAIKSDPQNPDNYIILAQVYLRLKSYARAVDTLTAAIRVNPDNGEVYYLLGIAEQLRGDKEKATVAAQKSVEIFMNRKDEEKFKRALLLLRSITGPVPQEQQK